MQTMLGARVTFSWLSVVGVVLGLAPTAMAGVPARYQVMAIRGYLYYQERGTFDSADILTGKVALRNIFIGEGDALTPSGAVLLLVDVEGPDFAKSVPPSAFLHVEAHSDGHLVVTARVRLRDLHSGSQRISVPVIAYGAFCSDLRIVARLEGLKSKDTKTAIAPFTCGE